LPCTQTSSVLHRCPHPPQSELLVEVSTQALPHICKPDAHPLVEHVLCEQTCPPAHTWPQAPQLFGSLVMSVHAPEHAVVPGRQPHAPDSQT
jgi:hypothetical protein